ncbi:hypothetical protein BDZ89DRAFT_1074130 [Hymenopellis radicata]|nr:hypothetical protein BDZ89DRAFT_1074130 [Hymenopellis radicata]
MSPSRGEWHNLFASQSSELWKHLPSLTHLWLNPVTLDALKPTGYISCLLSRAPTRLSLLIGELLVYPVCGHFGSIRQATGRRGLAPHSETPLLPAQSFARL